jgi:hypothetical protein
MSGAAPSLPDVHVTPRAISIISELGNLIRPPLALDPTAPISWTPQSLTAGGPSFMFSSMVPTPGPLFLGSITLHLGSGTVWLPAQQFAAAAPATRYFSLQIDSGVLQRSNPFLSNLPSALLSLSLTQAASGSEPLDITVSPPIRVEFSFTTTTSSLATATTGNTTIFGTAVNFDFSNTPPEYHSDFNRIEFPFQPENSTFAVTQSTSTLATFSGSTLIQSCAWSIQVVEFDDTTSFTVVAGAGGFSFSSTAGILVSLPGRQELLSCGPSFWIVEPTTFLIFSTAASSQALSQTITVGAGITPDLALTPTRSFLQLKCTSPSAFMYISTSAGTEAWENDKYTFLSSLSKPSTVDGTRLRLDGTATLQMLRNNPSGPISVVIDATQSSENSSGSNNSETFIPGPTFALKNLLLNCSASTSLSATGTYNNGNLDAGTLTVICDLSSVLPYLPDPYATNISSLPSPSESPSLGEASISWSWDSDPSKPQSIGVALPNSALANIARLTLPEDPNDSGTTLPGPPDFTLGTNFNLPLLWPTLLDVSTNTSQFGVCFSETQVDNYVSDLYLQSQLANTQLYTLPAVQWEPVQEEVTGHTYNFPSLGLTTQVACNSVSLVPISSRQTLDEFVNAYNSDLSAEITACFSLPFGLNAITQLQHSTILGLPSNIPSPGFSMMQPTSKELSLTSGDQLSLRAAGRPFTIGRPATLFSPTLPGRSKAMPAATDTTTSDVFTGTSVIDETINPTTRPDQFTSNAYDTTFDSFIPVSRIDLSGYGESLFTTWNSSQPNESGVIKVAFDTILGRTSREVVQVRSILAPNGAIVVRTITIERANSGAVFKSDTGWQATTDGDFQFPAHLEHPIISHPGVVSKVTNIKNIRNINASFVSFDCTIELENSVGLVETTALNQIGFIFEGSSHGDLAAPSAQEYASRLQGGSLGGPLDCNLKIAGSEMLMRVNKITVAATATTNANNDPEFVIAANGSPILPQGGQWSFVKTDHSVQTSTAVDKDDGVPLVRQATTVAGSNSNPYRFLDPSDLLTEVPPIDYGILHGTDSHRTLFSAPVIESTATGVAQALTSLIPPYIADSFALGTSSGVFPDLPNCIQIPSPTVGSTDLQGYNLNILPDSNLALQDITSSLPAITRTLQGDGNFQSAVRTAGAIIAGTEDTAESVANLLLNTVDQTWTMSISKLSMINYGQDLTDEISRVAGSISSVESQAMEFGSNIASSLASSLPKVPQLNFGKPLQDVQRAVAFLSAIGIVPPLAVAMTNSWSIGLSTTMGYAEFLAKLPPGLSEAIADVVTDFDLALHALLSLNSADFSFSLKLAVKVPTQFGPTAVGTAGFALDVGTSSGGIAVRLDLGAGVGVTFDAGPFHALAYFGVTQSVYKSPASWGLGTTATVRAHVDLVVATADLLIEAGMSVFAGTCQDDHLGTTIFDKSKVTSIAAYAQVEIALDVSIFWVINIHVHEQAEWQNNFRGQCSVAELSASLAGP